MRLLVTWELTLLRVDHVSVRFLNDTSHFVDALRDVSFDLAENHTLGIVGESGSGKSTIARAIMQLVPLQQGRIDWRGEDLSTLNRKAMQHFRRQIQLVFQDPLDALDPRMSVAEIIAEPLQHLRSDLSRREIEQRVNDMLAATGLSTDYLRRYPHEFSGGQCQRIGIARAMIVQPRLLICDEPVSALDVSIQAQVINLLTELRRAEGLSMIFISHDMSVVRHISERVLVLYAGRVVELADVEALFIHSRHPYTIQLMAAVPLADPQRERERLRTHRLQTLKSSPAVLSAQGCAFFSQCSEADEQCARQVPELRNVAEGHGVACHKR